MRLDGYYKLVGKVPTPCSMSELADAFNNDSRILKKTRIGDVEVSTVFLCIDHSFSDTAQPILFETLVFGGKLDGEVNRYSDYDKALEGHEEMCQMVRDAGFGAMSTFLSNLSPKFKR